MSIKDTIQALESHALAIQDFEWEGKPHKSARRVHTIEEYQAFLENQRKSLWSDYDNIAEELGWKD